MLLIVGLGNPGGQYALNRHNIGFMAADAIHRRHRFGPWRMRFQSEIAEGTLSGRKVLLMKPQTYMNESGRAVGEAARFLKIPNADIVVMHDELDLPPAKVRMKVGGGHGGHNGLRSISAHIGEDYRRLRLGIGHPGSKDLVHGYVLHDFAKVDGDWINPLLDAIADNAPLLADDKDSTFANRLHRAGEPEKVKKKQEALDAEPVIAKPAITRPVVDKPAAPGAEKPADGPFAAQLKRLLGKGE
ncbi:aminoacyl-tRNA hydrolase [Kaistia dalseonensis]|uniref:Peptidyl-tRNA hydrolase n=1 Tax=Kaistia dalseonensis TaxID=410840 RepID=A0ABU0H650_9HYPH|nr:aminoacyl-tRNA hydrolase [Kaistia dalseonensis]MCX5495192.1 aminoacyl-tRNA hydrolase [Kaistia dalseonensis]MDQ0437777.1 PTH1 family peptidyl-tRNA hydrolase [Kaistia dalseonensis]